MEYTGLLLSISLIYGVARFSFLFYHERNLKFAKWSLAFLFYALSSMGWIFYANNASLDTILSYRYLADWFQVCGVSFLLIALGTENWQDRPPVARFPYIFIYSPVLLILTFFLVHDTIYMKNLLIGIYEGGALFVALFIFGLYTSRNIDFLYTLLGLVILLLAFVVYWFPGGAAAGASWVWKLIACIGILCFITGYLLAYNKMEKEETEAKMMEQFF
ncbi:MAG: hypothetical protein LAT67_05705 [Balneolales bacterium]|nr:hypothetical protein [Balneolales bacterium]